MLFHVGLANRAAWDKCSTFDEYAHIGSGVSIWATGDYRMFPLGISQYRWMTLPIHWGGYDFPAPVGEMWRSADNWAYGRILMFQSQNDPQELLHTARLMTSVLSALLGAIVFSWAKSLFGAAGGFVSLLLYTFNPTILAHGSAATLDLAAALAFTGAMWTLWRILHYLTPARLAFSGLVWGLALTTKFSTLLLAPMAVALVALRLACARPWTIHLGSRRTQVTTRVGMLPHVALVGLVHVALSCFVIWLMFGFRFEMYRRLADGSLDPAKRQFSDWISQAGDFAPIVGLFHRWRLLPEAYLFGFYETLRTVAESPAFLNGRFGLFGFTSFFPFCLLYKTPLAVFFVGMTGVAAYFARRVAEMKESGRRSYRHFIGSLYTTAPLWCIVLVYGYTAITGHINIGIRHILPVFPALFILMGAAGLWLQPAVSLVTPAVRTGAGWFVMICLVWSLADVASAYPNYLAYFNVFGGGSKNGYKHLVDSSFDWGQELPGLKTWLGKVSVDPDQPRDIYLSYFGSTPPSTLGIRAKMLPCYFDLDILEPGLQQPFEPQLSAGTYVISATMVQSAYNPVAPGPWRKDYENTYWMLTGAVNEFLLADEARLRQLVDQNGPEKLYMAFNDFENLRFARLCAYLRHREPVATINHGLLIYNVTHADLQAALFDAPAELFDPPATPGGNVPY